VHTFDDDDHRHHHLEGAGGRRWHRALAGGGTLLPMNDVIRLARHAHHYLAIFDKGQAIGLYHTKRLASPGQRIVLCAKDRGCSHPGCDVSGYYCEVHHVTDYAISREIDVNDLTFGCGSHHRLVTPEGWKTHKRKNGATEWIPHRIWTTANPRSSVVRRFGLAYRAGTPGSAGIFGTLPLAIDAIIDGQYIDIAMLVNIFAMAGDIPLLPTTLDAAEANDPPGLASIGQMDWPIATVLPGSA
jgi:hypothetical protein